MRDSSQPPYFKDVRLVEVGDSVGSFPSISSSIRINIENKAFISPYIDREDQCRKCNTPFGPHLYKVGELVNASCFHLDLKGPGDDPGGIHFQYESDATTLKHGNTGWRAIVDPIGELAWWGYESDGCRAAPDVLVKEMVAFCYSDNPYRVDTNPQRLAEGYLMVSHLNGIVPICNPSHRFYAKEIVIGQFRIENGIPTLLPMED